MKQRDLRRLAAALEEQGCKVRRTRDGWFVQYPNGGGTSIHTSVSDSQRGFRNLRKDFERAGLVWPSHLKW